MSGFDNHKPNNRHRPQRQLKEAQSFASFVGDNIFTVALFFYIKTGGHCYYGLHHFGVGGCSHLTTSMSPLRFPVSVFFVQSVCDQMFRVTSYEVFTQHSTKMYSKFWYYAKCSSVHRSLTMYVACNNNLHFNYAQFETHNHDQLLTPVLQRFRQNRRKIIKL